MINSLDVGFYLKMITRMHIASLPILKSPQVHDCHVLQPFHSKDENDDAYNPYGLLNERVREGLGLNLDLSDLVNVVEKG